jgi:hypothetical protein
MRPGRLALLLVPLAIAGCGSGEEGAAGAGAPPATVQVAGVDFELPATAAAAEPSGAAAATISALLTQSGYRPKTVECYSKALSEAPAKQLEPVAGLPAEQRPAAEFAVATQLGQSCVGRNEAIVDEGASSEQLARFRELSSSQFTEFLAGQGANAKQSACVLGYYRKMSDERLVAWTNGPAPQQRSSLLNWAGRCQQVTQVIAPSE